MNILISGAGIAGPTLAYWLAKQGFTPTLVETAPTLRTGGYIIDFWGTGFDVADRMGLVPELMRRGYVVKEVRLVDAKGRRAGGFSAEIFNQATGGRYVSLPRGDLAAAIYATIDGKVETIFGDRLTALEPSKTSVRATFAKTPARDFDLVVGADGLHSTVRALTFGDQAKFERYMGYKVAAFEVPGYRPRDELVYVSYSEPGIQAARFAMRDDRTLILFVYTQDGPGAPPHDVAAQKAEVRARFANARWECPQMLAAMDKTDTLYVDRVSQIRMRDWAKDRVALIGDAAACPSLLAGQGSALAMIEAYVLADELAQAKGDHRKAFARYQKALRGFVDKKQVAAERFAGSFAPRTRLGLIARNLVTRAMSVPFVAQLALGSTLQDSFTLPDRSA